MSYPTFVTTIRERVRAKRPTFVTAVTNSQNDTLGYDIDVTEHDFMADSWRSLGIRIDMEGGDATVQQVTGSELGPVVSLRGDLDGYGVRELAFQRNVPLSAIRTAALRTARKVTMSGIRGTLGGQREYPLFDGHLRDAESSIDPGTVQLTAQEGTLLTRPIIYALAARSYTSRDTVVRDVCAKHGVPAGTLSWGAVTLGGYVVKEINEAGDRAVLAFLAEFVAAVGRRVFIDRGAVSVDQFLPSDTPVRTIALNDIRAGSLRVIPPPANAPNVVRMTSGMYGYVGPDLTGTVIATVIVTGNYTPDKAYEKQDKTTGVVTSVSPSTSPQTEVSKTVTTTVYDGGTIISQQVDKWGWYAPVAARKHQDSAGVVSWQTAIDCYHYASDGSWRSQDTETYQVIRRTKKWVYSWSNDGFLRAEFRDFQEMENPETYRGSIPAGSSTESIGMRTLI